MYISGSLEENIYFTDYCQKTLHNNEILAANSQISKYGSNLYEIRHNGQKNLVNLFPIEKCSCNYLFHYSIPCSHIILAVQYENKLRKSENRIDYRNFISKYFTLGLLLSTYMTDMTYIDFKFGKELEEYPSNWNEIKPGKRQKARKEYSHKKARVLKAIR